MYTKRYCDLNLFIELFNSINPIKLDQLTPFFGNIFENKIKKMCYKKSTFIISRKHILILYIKAYFKNLTSLIKYEERESLKYDSFNFQASMVFLQRKTNCSYLACISKENRNTALVTHTSFFSVSYKDNLSQKNFPSVTLCWWISSKFNQT